MNLTFKVILDKRRSNVHDTYPIKLRVYNRNEYNELFLRIKVKAEDWDEVNQLVLPSNPDHELYNAKITHEKSKLQRLILLKDSPTILPKDLIKELAPETPKRQPKNKTVSIINYGESIVKQLNKIGKVGNASIYTTAINKLKAFVKTDNFPFEALTYKKLNEFQASLSASGNKVNAISINLRTIRAIYNRAIKKGVASANQYPFRAFRIKNEKTPNRILTLCNTNNFDSHRMRFVSLINSYL